MDGHAALRDYQALRRIVATLIALAALAELAAARSTLVRCLVLWLLRPAEAVARAFVVGVTQTQRLAKIASTGNNPTEAIGLAMRFRALATALSDLLRLAWRSAVSKTRIGSPRFERHPGAQPIVSGGSEPRRNDTS